jgi:hypothetical protein
MRRRRSTMAGLMLALLLLAAAGWWFGSPYWILWRMQSAAAARDSEALSARVDWPALRENTKAQLRGKLERERAKAPEGGLGDLGAAIAGAMIGPAVEALVTPETVRAAFLVRPEPSATGAPAPAAKSEEAPEEFDVVRTGASQFRLRRKGAPEGEGELVFRREGLSWKLAAIELGD